MTLNDLRFEAWFIGPGPSDQRLDQIPYTRRADMVFGLVIPEVIITTSYPDGAVTGQYEIQEELRDGKPQYHWRPRR